MGTHYPKEGSLMYNIMNSKGLSRDIKNFKRANKYFVVPLFRLNILQLFGAGFIFVLVRTIGRKSLKRRYTPLEYRKFGDKYYLFASRGKKADWYRNMKAHPEEFRIKHHFFWKKPIFREVESTQEKTKLFKEYCSRYKTASKSFFGYDSKIDSIEDGDFAELSEFTRVIEFTFE